MKGVKGMKKLLIAAGLISCNGTFRLRRCGFNNRFSFNSGETADTGSGSNVLKFTTGANIWAKT